MKSLRARSLKAVEQPVKEDVGSTPTAHTRTPQFQAFLDSLEPQPWKRKKLSPNWATCHFNPVPK